MYRYSCSAKVHAEHQPEPRCVQYKRSRDKQAQNRTPSVASAVLAFRQPTTASTVQVQVSTFIIHSSYVYSYVLVGELQAAGSGRVTNEE